MILDPRGSRRNQTKDSCEYHETGYFLTVIPWRSHTAAALLQASHYLTQTSWWDTIIFIVCSASALLSLLISTDILLMQPQVKTLLLLRCMEGKSIKLFPSYWTTGGERYSLKTTRHFRILPGNTDEANGSITLTVRGREGGGSQLTFLSFNSIKTTELIHTSLFS